MTLKTIKELEEMYNKSRMSYFWLGYEKALKEVLEVIDKRIKDLEQMMEVDEKEMWETSNINFIQAKAIYDELKELKARINGK